MFTRNKRGPTPSVINPRELELKLNLSPPRRPARAPPAAIAVGPRSRMMSRTSPEVSPPKSCVSSEDSLKSYSSSPETTSMVLAGCPRCLMYVMVPASDTLCPRCQSPVLLDFMADNNNNNNDNNNGGNNN